MSTLHTQPRLEDPDDFYFLLAQMSADIEEPQRLDFALRLLLLLANEVGRKDIIRACMYEAGRPFARSPE
jgi:hypothetical protein